MKRKTVLALLTAAFSLDVCAYSQNAKPDSAAKPTEVPVVPLTLDLPHSSNPFGSYKPTHIKASNLDNSVRLGNLIHDGVLDLSLNDAIDLALENNLDIAIARYNLFIAQADILRTRAGGVFRGVNTGVIQNTPGGGVGGFGSGASGAGTGGTTGGAGGAGSGASGLVQSTLGAGTNVASYDPVITGNSSVEHYSEPLSNTTIYGVQVLHTNTIVGNLAYSQAFPTGTSFSFVLDNSRVTQNSPYTFLNPRISTYYRVLFQQQLLAGAGFGSNLRYLRIAKNNQKISDVAFELQVITTVTQIANLYWDLSSAYQDIKVKGDSLEFATQTLNMARRQLELQAIPAVDVMKDEGEVANREQDLSIARSQLELQELLMKNAITRNLDDALLDTVSVKPTDAYIVENGLSSIVEFSDVDVDRALSRRVELKESVIDLDNRKISRRAAEDALLPSLALTGYYAGSGLAGPVNPAAGVTSTAPGGYGGALQSAFGNGAPDYFVGLSLNLPLRNRVAKSDQYRAELEFRQAELRFAQLRKQIRIEVRNAEATLQETSARVRAAIKARTLAAKTFEIMKQEQTLGAGSALQTLGARHDLATTESTLVVARTAFQKALIEFDRAVGDILEKNGITLASARSGTIVDRPPVSSR